MHKLRIALPLAALAAGLLLNVRASPQVTDLPASEICRSARHPPMDSAGGHAAQPVAPTDSR
nr:hypothetical protein [uncultured Roseateles sp.]